MHRHNNLIRVLLFIVTLLPIITQAEEQLSPWLIKTDPDKLALFVSSSKECPFTKEKLQKIADGEFLRARITPTREWSNLTLNVTIMCVKLSNGSNPHTGYAVHSGVTFSVFDLVNGDRIYGSHNESGMTLAGPDDGSYILDKIRNRISNALTTYLKANFSK